MDLVEGISNEVLIAFIVTILLIVVAAFYTFFTQRTGASPVQSTVSAENVDGDRSETRGNVVGNQSGQNSSANTRESALQDIGEREDRADHSMNRDPVEDVVEASENSDVSEDTVRRRVVDGSREEARQDETMVVKVKHNENIQIFTVSIYITVVELKRMAFGNELNAGKRVRFVYAGQLLRNDNDLLTRYGVLPNTVVHCVITDPPEQPSTAATERQEEDLDLTRLLVPLLTMALIMAWYGLISYKHIFTGSSIAILMFLTSLYVILVYVTTIQ